MSQLPLSDVCVVDISVTLPGPYASQLLSQLGADVLSVEPPAGDPLRHRGPTLDDGRGRVYASLNRGKTSIELDLKDQEGVEFLMEMVPEIDVFIEGFRPGAVDRLGLGPADIRERNPDVVYCSVSGYGQDGSRVDEVGHSLNYEGLAGLLDPDDPSFPRFPVADFAGGTMLALAAVGAIRARDRGAGGQYVDVGLFEVIASWNQWHAGWYEGSDEFDFDPLVCGVYPCYNTYETADGKHLTLGALETTFWEDLCDELGCPQLADAQFDTGGRTGEAYRELQSIFLRKPLEAWIEDIGDDLPVAAVRSNAEAIEDQHLADRERVVVTDSGTGETIHQFGFPVEFSESAPEAAGSSLSTWSERAGYDDGELAALEASSVLRKVP